MTIAEIGCKSGRGEEKPLKDNSDVTIPLARGYSAHNLSIPLVFSSRWLSYPWFLIPLVILQFRYIPPLHLRLGNHARDQS